MESAKKQKENVGFVLNRMYTGSYLSTNLGHEVINMFQADNGKHYLYLNSRGNLVGRALTSKYMLLVVYIGDQRVEVIGLAKNIVAIDSAKCNLSEKIGKIDKKIFEKQNLYIEKEHITYGGVHLLDIFNDAEQQNIYVSYEADPENFFIPKQRIILSFKKDRSIKDDKVEDGIYKLGNYDFGSTTLHQYIESGKDYDKLESVITNEKLWILSNEKVEIADNCLIKKDSLIDICGMLFDENKFSNALAYFIRKYTELWRDFFILKSGMSLNLPFEVSREVDIKSKFKDLKDGGRIDLQINDGKHWIIIENKIKSKINKTQKDKTWDSSQLKRYMAYIKKIAPTDNKENSRTYVLTPNYNMLSLGDTGFQLLNYSEICLFLKGKKEVETDEDFKSFYKAMLYHSYNNECMSMYEKMKEEFYNRIYKFTMISKKEASKSCINYKVKY